MNSGGYRPDIGGSGSHLGGAKKGFHLFKYPRFSVTIVDYHAKVFTFCRPRKWLFLLVQPCGSVRE